LKVYGIAALRQLREQQAAEPDPPVDEVAARSEADQELLGSPDTENETDDEQDAFEALYEAWIDFGMESGG
jgi:hypothetical protein